MDPERKAKLAIGVVICVVIVFALAWGVVAILPSTGDEVPPPPPAREEPREPIMEYNPSPPRQTYSAPTERKPVNEEGPTRPGYTWVNGYYRKDGTYVRGHWRKK